jgi:SAM-dependent methyltransferase
MTQNQFDLSKFKPFQTSSGLDGSSTGLYENKIIRLVNKNNKLFTKILNICGEFDNLIESKKFYEDEKILAIEHEMLDNITYYTEWTKKQKVTAAKTIVELQTRLAEKGFYLNDPHAFNITFKFHQPVYFDYGSIKEGNVKPIWWFLKCFCGWTEMDYWDSVLKINFIHKYFIILRMMFSKSPYNYLFNNLSKFEKGLIEAKLIYIIKSKNLFGKVTRKIVTSLPDIFKNLSNWSDYDQKSPELNFENARNKNILEIFNRFKPKKVLDIGANRGAYSLLALQKGAEAVIAVDLDNYSLDWLMEEIKEHNQNVTVAKLNIMDYPDKPGHYKSYLPAHERLSNDFAICLAVVHHVCYFGNYSFDEFAERLNRFAKKNLIVEFVPNNDIHLTGNIYKGKDRSWYTLDNFVIAFKKYFLGEHEIFDSTPSPRILIKFCK